MPTPSFLEIMQILQEHGITVPEVESALGEWVGKIVDQRLAEQPQGEIMDMDNLIKHLEPYKISRSTVDKWIMNSKRRLPNSNFPFHKAGRRLHFYKSEIDSWLRSKYKQF